MTGITLETQRLILRQPDARDVDGIVRYFTSDRSQYTAGPVDHDTAWRFACVEIGHWAVRGYGMFAVCPKDQPDQSIGIVGAWYPEGWPEPELGWLMWPEGEGKGYAFEAAEAARGFVYADLGWETAVSYIAHENHRSKALAEKLGCVLDPNAATPRGEPCFVYRHPDPAALMDGGMEAYA